MNVHRRDFVRNISLGAGSLVLSPIFQQLQAQAAGAPAPKRFVFVVEGNGLPWKQIQPIGIERANRNAETGGLTVGTIRGRNSDLTELPIGDHELPEAIDPISPWKNRVSIVQGLSGRVTGGGHSSDFGALGVYAAKGSLGSSGMAQGETVDAALARKIGGIFPHVGLGISDREEHTVIYNLSAWGKGKPMPTQCRPDLAHGVLFGSVAGGSAKQEFAAQGNMLDFLSDDLRRLQRQTAGAEREKLDAHLAAYEALSNRRSRLNEIENTLRQQAPVTNDKYKSEVETDRLDAHFDLAAAALIGGLTNVVTLSSGAGSPYFSVKFTGLGVNCPKHGIGHDRDYKGVSAWDLSVKIRRFHFELIARLMKKLESVPEAGGTMLDNTLIVYLSDGAEAHHSRCWEWPMVLIGNLGGTLRMGRYVEYPYWGLKGHKTIGNMYATLLDTVGDRRAYSGMKDPLLRDIDIEGPLSELRA